ncbi:MAG: helix-turn-helix domain-containing protein [Roseibacillus sp.]
MSAFLDGVEGLRLVLKDLEYRYQYVSEGWEESTGLREVLGKTVFDVFPLWRAQKYHREEVEVIESEKIVDTFEEIVMVEGGREQLWRSLKGPRRRNGKVVGMVIIGLLVDPNLLRGRLVDERPEAVDWLERHAMEEMTMLEVSEKLGMSQRTLEREFQRKTGMSPASYRLKCRVARGRDLLRYSSKSLAEIASECGFHDQSHFSRVFSSEEGLTPGRWRLEAKAKS